MKTVYCNHCGIRTGNDEIALNIKIFGKQVGMIRCYNCLSEFLGCDSAQLKRMSLHYKDSGCSVFLNKYTEEGALNE